MISAKNHMDMISNARHRDPFEHLGIHAKKAGMLIRAFMPEASEVWVVRDGQKIEMSKVREDGFFEALFKDKEIFQYKLAIKDFSGNQSEIFDPYCFSPVLSEYDLYLMAEGTHYDNYEKMGAHPIVHQGVNGTSFAVWAPNAIGVSVIGDFNNWDGRRHPMRVRGGTGIWELFIPELSEGTLYKYEIKSDAGLFIKSDPYGFYNELRPKTASIVWDVSKYKWNDHQWIDNRGKKDWLSSPISIYEVHLGSWMRKEGNQYLTYKELAENLTVYVKKMGYTHIEIMPALEHPFDGSWGYQTLGYFSVTSRFGTPEDFMSFVDTMHQNGIGIIMDWVPAHFPKDAHGLAYFDGTFLYEHEHPFKREHMDWGTLIFNYGRTEVASFLLNSALFWLDKYHIDGLRVDAVASMLYLDYSRKSGEWIPNQYGGNENIEAIAFLRRFNELCYERFQGVLTIAEESTAWPMVSRPTYMGGLGFSLKWNMGWMNDTLSYFSKEPIHRKYHQNNITFGLIYAFHENFVLVLSHDEVVHGKRALLDKMPGDLWQKFANLRLLLGYMFAHPGKKMLFMGGDIGQWAEWYHDQSIDWHLLEYEPHERLQAYVHDLNAVYKSEPSMYEVDFDYRGFEWIDFGDSDASVVSFVRRASDPSDFTVFVFNLTPVPRYNYRVGVPQMTVYSELLNSDSSLYWGSNMGNSGVVHAEAIGFKHWPYSVSLTLPPLAMLMLKPLKPV